MLVLLHHMPEVEGPLRVLRPLQAIGWAGVGLFLVVSGFSIHYRVAERGRPGGFEAKRFWRRRFRRLYPTYLSATVTGLVLLVLVGEATPVGQNWNVVAGASPVVVALLSQPLLVLANVMSTPYLNVSWSLALEIQLYAVYATFVRHLRRIGIGRLVLASLVLAVLWRIGAELVTTSVPVGQFKADGSASTVSRVLYMQVPARWFEWMLGVLVAEAYFDRARLWRVLSRVEITLPLLLVAGFLFRNQAGQTALNGHTFFVSDVVLDPLFGIVCAGALAWTVGLANVRPGPIATLIFRPLAVVGVFSYSLYLMHAPLLRIAVNLVPGAAPNTVLETVCAAVALAGSYAFFLLIEKRFLRPGRELSPVEARAVTVAGVG